MFTKQKIFILGFARSGYEAAKFLIDRGNHVLVNDQKKREAQDLERVLELEALGVQFVFGSHPLELLDDSYDYVIKNPGIAIDHPIVNRARDIGVPVINEVEMAYRLLPADVTLIGITGTNGKTTTTSLIYEMIKASGKHVYLAGNIGYPLCSFIDKLEKNDIIVMEVSCQQLENVDKFRPDIAVMTNLSPAHIDFLHSYENYKRVKAKIFQNQTKDDLAVLNIENEDVLVATKEISSQIRYFSSKNEINGSYLQDDILCYYGEPIIARGEVFLKGVHNIENCLAAITVCKALGIKNESIISVLRTFKGVEHRLEFVAEIDKRKFYNDTEATNIKCTQIALSSFVEPVILILGGLERGQVFEDLIPYLEHVKAIVGIGGCRERVLAFGVKQHIPTYSYEHLKDGFKKCYEISEEGDIVLLSPASASWDQYKQCEDRGAEFKKYVEELKNED